MTTRTMRGKAVSFLCLCLVGSACFAAETGWRQAEGLLQEGRAESAYTLLAPLEFDQAGNPDYDYLLGIAALDSGRPDRATLAFERVLAINPDHAGARMDLARAYFAMGDYSRAKQEFETVARQNPPAAARATIDRHLAAIEAHGKAQRPGITGYLETVAGHDDNITSVTSDFTSAVNATYGLPGIRPTGNAIKREDGYATLGGGVEYHHPIDHDTRAFAGLDARYTGYSSYGNYDTGMAGGRAGIVAKREAGTFKFTFNVQRARQEGETPGTPRPRLDRNTSGAALEWSRAWDARNEAGLFAQYSQLRYPDIPTNDMNQTTLGASWLHALPGPQRMLVFSSVFATQESAITPLANGSDYGKQIRGVRLSGQLSLADKLDAFASLGCQWRNDDMESARQTGVTGKDRLADASLGLNWQPGKDWTVRPQISYSKNRSNILLYEYDRTDISVTVRKDFR